MTAVAVPPLSASGAIVRLATPADDAARCELLARVEMEAELALSVRRGPRFEALYALQSDDRMEWVVELDGRVEGLGTALARDAYLGGRRIRVGYLGDLRFSPRVQGRQILERFYAPVLREATERFGCELFLTAVIASNTRALRALTVQTARAAQRGRPRYTLLREFSIRSVHLLPPRRAEGSPFTVRRATMSDLGTIAELLDRDARARPFGFPYDDVVLRRRLHQWPGLTPSSFYLAEERSGAVVGCAARWDAAPVKRTFVTGYRGSMRRVRLLYDLAARALGRPRLPAPGGEFRYCYVTHQAVPSADPRILRTLLGAMYADARAERYQFLSAFAPHGDPMDVAFRGFATTDLAARLYLVTLPGTPIPAECFGNAPPGFEMALV